jgi:hypothetical protein
MKHTKQEVEEARGRLLELLKPGDTVYTVLRHVSRSGMSRVISLYVIVDGEPRWLDGYASRVMGTTLDRDREGLKIGGCGMDMGFALVYDLSYCLWPKGVPCTGEHCLSNDHSNGDRDYTVGKVHQDGGYALRQRWM